MMSPLSGSVWRRAQKGDNAVAWPLEFCLWGSCPQPLAWVPDPSISSHMPGISPATAWSPEGVSLHRSSVPWGPWKRRLLRIPVSSTAPIPTGYYSQKLWELIFLTLEPWAGWYGVSGVPYSWGISILSTTVGCGTARSASLRLWTHLDECDFFNSLVVGLPYQSIFWWFWVITVL